MRQMPLIHGFLLSPNSKSLAWGFSHLRSDSFTRCEPPLNIAHSIARFLEGVFRCLESRLLLHWYSPVNVEHAQGCLGSPSNLDDANMQATHLSMWALCGHHYNIKEKKNEHMCAFALTWMGGVLPYTGHVYVITNLEDICLHWTPAL